METSEVLIVGGGAIGLATALELALRGVSVTVLSRNFQEAALYAAAGTDARAVFAQPQSLS
jgi:glycine/D-amino acid oxidase-like deaminating enzyme